MNTQQTIELSGKSLNNKIDALAKKHVGWRDEVQLVLVACAKHTFEHGDVDGFTRIVGVLQGADMKAIVSWAVQFAPCTWHKAEVKFTKNKSFEGEFDGLYLAGQSWWIAAKSAKEVDLEYDILEVVKQMIKRAEREVNAKVQIKTVINQDLLKLIGSTLHNYEESGKVEKFVTVAAD